MQHLWLRPPPDDDTLVVFVPQHTVPGIVCNGKDVWLLVSNLLVTVALDVLRIIDGQLRVGVHGNQDGARVGLQVCVCGGVVE